LPEGFGALGPAGMQGSANVEMEFTQKGMFLLLTRQ
jgi:hypothetical protein